MTAQQFREMALSLPEVNEQAHMGHPDFRVGGKIFATLGYPGKEFGVVIISPADQARFVQNKPDVFLPASGAWGLRGSTQVRLSAIDKQTLHEALTAAWRRRAPKRLHAFDRIAE